MKQPELSWVAEARSWIGTAEIKGIKHNPKIVGLWPAIGITWFKDDETPWCAGALTLWCKRSGVCLPAPAKPAAALSYLEYGTKLSKPAYGAIAVKKRKGGGHVGIVVGKYGDGRLGILGANQDDQVKVSPYKASDFETFRWPTGNWPNQTRYDLPLLNNAGRAVSSEG
jgi:uncharacterized protein (TIGR02594 family)